MGQQGTAPLAGTESTDRRKGQDAGIQWNDRSVCRQVVGCRSRGSRDHAAVSDQLLQPDRVIDPDAQLGTLAGLTQPEPAGPALFLRFAYRTTLSETVGDDAKYVEYVRSAYHQSDVDTVRVVRIIAQSTRTE